MSGIQEILVLAIILLAILFIPRMRAGGRVAPLASQSLPLRMSGKLRLALVASIVYPAAVAAILQPWKADLVRFFYIGIGPVVLIWLLYWVINGFNKKKL